MPDNAQEIAVLTLGPWGGVQYRDAASIEQGKSALAINVEPNLNNGALTSSRFPTALLPVISNLTMRGLYSRLFSSNSGVPAFTPNQTEQFFFVGFNNTGSYSGGSIQGTLGVLVVYRVDRPSLSAQTMYQCPINGSTTILGSSALIGAVDLSMIPMEEFGDQIFFSVPAAAYPSPGPTGWRIDANGNVWSWMPAPPNTYVSLAATGTGPLNGTYQYLTTYAGVGFETSPNLAGPYPTVQAAAQNIQLSNIIGSSDPTVTTVNIYRLGGNAGVNNFELVGSVPNGTTTYTDTLADNLITGTTITTHQDQPPFFVAIRAWKNRMWGLSATYTAIGTYTGTQLYYSLYGTPRAFDTTSNVIPVGLGQYTDSGVALAIVNGALLIFNRHSVWVAGGDSSSDFVVEPLFPSIGAYSARCVVEAAEGVFWLAADWQIYFFGTQLEVISEDIQDFLYLNNGSFNSATTLSFKDNVLYFSPGFGYQSLAYNIKTKQWYNGFLPIAVPFSRRNKCYGLNTSGGISVFEVLGSSSGYGNYSATQYQSGESYAPMDSKEKNYTKFVISGTLSGFTVLFEVDPSTLGEPAGPTLLWTPPGTGSGPSTVVVNFLQSFKGKRIRVTITSVSVAGAYVPIDIRKLTVFAQAVRDLDPVG